MWSFGHSVREIERSHHRVVIEESATLGAVWLFGGFALLALLLWATKSRSTGATLVDEAPAAFAVCFFALLALYASVRSTYTADRLSRQLIVERRILFSTIRTAYDTHTIDRVYVRHTQKGSGFYVRFRSGRNKRLSMSLEFTSLEGLTVALNTILYTHPEH
jgi:hypothetical protein